MGVTRLNDEIYFSHRPMPENDEMDLDKITSSHLFGFQSVQCLKNWFLDADCFVGSLFGRVLCFYDVAESGVVYGRRQLTFDSTKSKLICKAPMDHYNADKSSTHDLEEMIYEAIGWDFPIPDEIHQHHLTASFIQKAYLSGLKDGDLASSISKKPA